MTAEVKNWITEGLKGDGRRRVVANDYHPLLGVNQPALLSELGSVQMMSGSSASTLPVVCSKEMRDGKVVINKAS